MAEWVREAAAAVGVGSFIAGVVVWLSVLSGA